MHEVERLSTTIDDYHNNRQWFSNSDLSHLATWTRGEPTWTPHLMCAHLNRSEPTTPTKAMEFGQAFDELITEPERFEKRYDVAPVSDKRTKAYKSFVAANPFKAILTSADYDSLMRMHDSLVSHPEFPDGNPTHTQSTIRWKHSPEIGLQCRPDLEFDGLVVDVKTTICTGPQDWMADVAKFGYHRQAALYLDGAGLAAGRPLSFLFAVVSKVPPYAAWIAELPDHAIALGRSQNNLLLSTLADHLLFDVWAAPWQAEISTLDLPYWAYPKE